PPRAPLCPYTTLFRSPTIATGGSAVAVTGATGLLGSEVVRELTHAGTAVRAVVRREPAPWEQIPGVEYVVADLGAPLATGALRRSEEHTSELQSPDHL